MTMRTSSAALHSRFRRRQYNIRLNSLVAITITITSCIFLRWQQQQLIPRFGATLPPNSFKTEVGHDEPEDGGILDTQASVSSSLRSDSQSTHGLQAEPDVETVVRMESPTSTPSQLHVHQTRHEDSIATDIPVLTSEELPLLTHTKTHSCTNSDFQPTHDKAVFTLLIPLGDEHINAAIVLGASLTQWHGGSTSSNITTSTAIDRVVIELSTHPLSRHQWARLQRSGGWTHKCTVEPIRASKRPSPRFKDQFAKLRVWGMTVYSVAIYMDADTFVMGSLEELWNLHLGNYRIGVTEDYRIAYGSKTKYGDWVSSFNMGVFVVHPNATEYERLVQMQSDGVIQEYEHIMAEQGWLNAVYKDQWKEIGLRYNANIAARGDTRFREQQHDLRIVHYTTMKPWYTKTSSPDYAQFSKPWVETRELSRRYGCINDDFVPPTGNHNTAMVTFVTSTVEIDTSGRRRKKEMEDYTYGAAALIKSIQEYASTGNTSSNFNDHRGLPFDTILLEIPSRRLPDADRAWLKELGWNMCMVKQVEARHKPFGRFIDQFNKFHVWSFVEYDNLVYLDSDNLVTGNIDGLLQRKLSDGMMIGVTRDYFSSNFVDTFNMGVFLIHPNLTEFHRLSKLQGNDEIKYDTAQAEQGFLNKVYKDQWEEIGLEYNANMAVWATKPEAWPANPKIKHYTLEKPWQESVPQSRAQSVEPLDVFLNTWKVKARQYGVWPFEW